MSRRGRTGPVTGLVRPVSVATGGITRGETRGAGWIRTSVGYYVPAGTDRTRVEQRILEQSVRMSGTGAVTGWAALRLLGGRWFDGLEPDGVTAVPVPIAAGADRMRVHPDVDLCREVLADSDVVVRHGIRCADAEAALFAEIRRRGELREAVVAIDMAAAGELTSLRRFGAWLARQPNRRGLALARQAIALAVEDSWSPMETRLRLIWVLDLGWPTPLCNRRVYLVDDGRLLGRPDLLDPESGLGGEFDGADHRGREHHRSDVRREDDFRQAGLESVTFVGADLADGVLVAGRLRSARSRCGLVPRRWTLAAPEGQGVVERTLDERLDHRDLMRELHQGWDEEPDE